MEFGETLKNGRLARGLTLEDLEEETKIRKYYLAALEENQFHQLPARVYAVGFVKRYARSVGLNEDQIVEQFIKLAYPEKEVDAQAESGAEEGSNDTAERYMLPLKNLAAGLVFLIMIGAIGYLIFDLVYHGPGKSMFPSRVAEETKQPAKADHTKKNQENKKGINVTLKAKNRCWVQVSSDNQPTFTGTMYNGDEKSFSAADKIDLVLGNAGGIDVTYNGKPLGAMGAEGQVVRTAFPPEKKDTADQTQTSAL